MRPVNRTVTIGALVSNIEDGWSCKALDVFEGWDVSKFEPRYTFDGEWVDTWMEVTITTKRVVWEDYGDDILSSGWSIV